MMRIRALMMRITVLMMRITVLMMRTRRRTSSPRAVDLQSDFVHNRCIRCGTDNAEGLKRLVLYVVLGVLTC
jgi:hypothetical protein